MYINAFGDVFEEVLYVKPSYSFFTLVSQKGFVRTARQKFNEVNLKENNQKGKKSLKACKNIRMVLGFMLMAAKWKYVFNKEGVQVKQYRLTLATFTLPSKQRHSDNEIKAVCLNQLLVELRKKYRVYNYIWLAEPQSNGNIHFHVTLDRYIDKKKLQKMWNRIINKLGYVDEFEKKHGYNNPPSTHIAAIKNVRNIEAYFSGEFTGDKSKDYATFTNKETGEEVKRFKGCNPYALIGHERANLPNNPAHEIQESNYAEFKNTQASKSTPSLPFSIAYIVPDMPDYDNSGNIIDNENKELEAERLNEQKTPSEDYRFYIERRPIEGRVWAAGGNAAKEKGIKIVLDDEMSKSLKKAIKAKPDMIRIMERQNKLTGEKFSFGSLVLLDIMAFHDSPLEGFSKPIKELLQRLQSPFYLPLLPVNKVEPEPSPPPEIIDKPPPVIPDFDKQLCLFNEDTSVF